MTTSNTSAEAGSGITVKFLLLGFAAGFLAVPLGHQVMAFVHYLVGWRPTIPWDMGPNPRAAFGAFGLPSMINLAFWGGVWGVLWALIEPKVPRGWLYWVVAIIFGAVCATAVSAYVVPLIKGLPQGSISSIGLMLNGAWGLVTAFLLDQMRRRF